MPGDETFMRRAIELAAQGRGQVEPNPMVGCVLVRDGRVVGEGWHRRFGEPHAELEAIAAAARLPAEALLARPLPPAVAAATRGATLYVSLEPCCHRGKKTPPCTEALLQAGIARVVVAMPDPDPNVRGRGLAELRQAGVEVVEGVLEAPARRLLAAYVKLRTLGRPWVIAKWAQSLDGRIACHTGHSQWISGSASRRRVHLLRGQCDGVCVGVGTVLADDPRLTNRSGVGRQPARLVLDPRLQTPPTCRLLAPWHGQDAHATHGQDARATRDAPRSVPSGSATRDAHATLSAGPALIACLADAPADRAAALREAGAELLPLPAGSGGLDLPALLDELGRRRWTNLLVEGGRGVLSSFIRQRLTDELLVFVAPLLVGGQRSLGPVDWPDVDTMPEAYPLPAPEVETIENDVLLRYRLTGQETRMTRSE